MLKSYKGLFFSTIAYMIFLVLALVSRMPVIISMAFYGFFVFLTFIVTSRKSILRNTMIEGLQKKDIVTIIIFVIVICLVMIVPMGISPFWNGERPEHRNQYELMADSIINGHLYFEYEDIDSRLLEMENPYDLSARLEQGINYHWDHAFYKGRYYMYFGVVPVITLFVPFKLLFGTSLVTYHATQLYVTGIIIGFFFLFYLIALRFFRKMSIGTYLIATTAICFISVGYCVQAPALYCTAISAGVFFALWSIVFYFYAVYYAKKESVQILFACLGAFFGALAFGCRPPVAMANLIAIPLAITYSKNYKGKHLVRNFVFVSIPYVVIAALLMAYNYVRFDNPFEFGQAYQLTSTDQTVYLSFFERMNFFNLLNTSVGNFFTPITFTDTFPFVNYGGMITTYPLMWLLILYFTKDSVRRQIRADKLNLFVWMLLLETIITTVVDAYWSPWLYERYRMDEYFVLGILVFVLAGYRISNESKRDLSTVAVNSFAGISILLSVLMFFNPFDVNFAASFPNRFAYIAKLLSWGL